MYQYDSKDKVRSDKSNTNTVANNSHVQTVAKIPVQTKSLFSPSFNRESSTGNQSLNYESRLPRLTTILSYSPMQTQLMPKREKIGINPFETNSKEEQMQFEPASIKPNNTGIPIKMKEKFESLSGFSFDDVKVHYNSDKPAQLQAFAYTQGNEVHVAPGQEKHLAHELGHVVQQKSGIVSATGFLNGIPINDEAEMEHQADRLSVTPSLMHTTKKPLSLLQLCRWCGDESCVNSSKCNIGTYTSNSAFTSARRRVAVSGVTIEIRDYGEQVFDIGGGNRSGLSFFPVLTNTIKAACKKTDPSDGGEFIQCPYCKYHYDPANTAVDHMTAWREYLQNELGTTGIVPKCVALILYNDPRNLVPACKWCNSSKGDRTPDADWISEREKWASETW